MGIDDTNKIILGSQRFQGATDIDLSEKIVLQQTSKEQVEYDRYIDVNLLTVFDKERQNSNTFRPVSKYSVVFKNAYQGVSSYEPYYNYLFYTNIIQNTQNTLCYPNVQQAWSGFPQYTEFDFIRTDNDKPGYTIGQSNHQPFVSKSATTYNWNHYISYPFDNDYNKVLYMNDPEFVITWYWVSGDGIPYYIKEINNNIISFRCPMKHGLSVGEYVNLGITYNNINSFMVTSLGDNGSGSDEYIFNIDNVGFVGGTFSQGVTGNLKRVINPDYSGETTSEYYVRKHKIITNPQDAVVVNSGFEQNIFNLVTQYEKVYSGGTPLQSLSPSSCPRTSILEGSQSYNISFSRDIVLNNLIDNQKRPVTEIYFTTVWKGYYGWTNRLKEGHFFNAYLDGNTPNAWWDSNNTLSDSTIPFGTYFPNNINGIYPCYYTENLLSGDTIDGDYCEWNDYEQKERVISSKLHKFTFNQNYFTTFDETPNTNKFGYYYFPLNPMKLKVYSEYVEEGEAELVEDIPPYAFFSNLANGFRWRDIYPYGYVDSDGLGVDYPFTNGKHYPFKNTIFRIFSEGIGTQNITTIQDPTIDGCE
jgi:hypothetical protein